MPARFGALRHDDRGAGLDGLGSLFHALDLADQRGPTGCNACGIPAGVAERQHHGAGAVLRGVV